MFLIGIFRIVAMTYAKDWYGIGKKCLKDEVSAQSNGDKKDWHVVLIMLLKIDIHNLYSRNMKVLLFFFA